MSITNEFFVYYQGDEDYFLKIKVTYTATSNLFQLFGSFLNEFISTYKIKNRNTENTQFYTINTITDKKTLITQFCSQIPDTNYEYLIRAKEIADDSSSITTSDQSLIDAFLEEGELFESIGLYYSAYNFYSLTGKNGISYLMKMFYSINDFQSISKYISEITPQFKKDPFINEILGYTYEWLNNKSKAAEFFSIFKDKLSIQCVAYNRLLYSLGPSKTRNQLKSFIEKDLLSCMKTNDISFDVQSLFYCTVFNIPPRSEKVYTHEVVKTFVERSMWKEAIEFCVKNVRYFKYNLPLLAINSNCSNIFADSIINPTLTIPVARKVCSCFIYGDQIDSALKIANFLYNRNKHDVQSISLLMYIYYCMMKFDEIGRIAFELIDYFPSDTIIYDIRMSKLLEKLPVIKKNLGIESQKKHNFFDQFDSFNIESANKELDPIRMYDRFNFIIFIILYFFINHNLKEAIETILDYDKAIQTATMCHDEAYEIFNNISQFQINPSTSIFFNDENQKICILGDFTIFNYTHTIFKITNKAVKQNDNEEKSQKTRKNKKNDKNDKNENENEFYNNNSKNGNQFWCFQPLLTQNDQGFLVQLETFYVPEFSLWRIREEKHGKKFINRVFDERLQEIKDFLIKSNQDDEDPFIFAFGKRDIVKHIPNLIMKRKFISIDELENKYSSLFLNTIKRIRSFLPKKKIAVHLDYTDYLYFPYSSILYNAICKNLPENVELTISQEEFNNLYCKNGDPFTVDNSIDIINVYSYNYYLLKSKKQVSNGDFSLFKKAYFPLVD